MRPVYKEYIISQDWINRCVRDKDDQSYSVAGLPAAPNGKGSETEHLYKKNKRSGGVADA